jgi:hypothetical protein
VRYVSVFMDVEDPVNLAADDAALDLANLFTSCGARGSFCVTGEKCRSLLARGRADVAEALQPHCLGLHTDTHSLHPTTMELLAEVDFAEGCRLALEAEGRGVKAFHDSFGRTPAFWGGAGNTWGPEIPYALRELGVPAYSYALTALPGEPVHRFNGAIALPQHLSLSEEGWMDETRAADRSRAAIEAVTAAPQPWLGIFVGHPTRFRHAAFWDWPYGSGRAPREPEATEEISQELYDRTCSNLRSFLLELKEVGTIVGVDDALALPWRFRSPTTEEAEYFAAETEHRLRSVAGWPIHRPGLDVSGIVRKTLELQDTVEVGGLAQATSHNNHSAPNTP